MTGCSTITSRHSTVYRGVTTEFFVRGLTIAGMIDDAG